MVLAAKLLGTAICYVNEVTELYWSQYQSLSNATRNQPKAGIINHTHLQLMAQPIFHPPHWPVIQSPMRPSWLQALLSKSTCTALLLPTESSIPSRHTVGLVRHIFPLVNQSCLSCLFSVSLYESWCPLCSQSWLPGGWLKLLTQILLLDLAEDVHDFDFDLIFFHYAIIRIL